ncbi:DUF305 domain-containing protein [Maritimibacter alexandrii]|uniref:DUF305 domain-containing protein n=1 Tax=Maritimibacter alexandrii TaxID=2570355 RepID=UPI001BB0E26A|nr:DUF305 domain-containing protein [Maritimibacter alexandrii]
MSYWRFFAMIATSTVVMFGLMYLNTYLIGHVFFSETRTYMAVLMGATMAIVMLAFMLGMYPSKVANAAIFAGSVVVFALMLFLVRSQVTVGDLSYMRAMIPHHSIAIMTSNRANFSDPRVQSLADDISYAQNKEIAEMRYLIDDISANGDATGAENAPEAGVVSLSDALASPMIRTLDAQPLTEADIAAGLPGGADCFFAFTTDSPPALAMGEGEDGPMALMKISDDLVVLREDGDGRFTTEGATVALTARAGDTPARADEDPTEATMKLTLDAGLNAGYRGWFACAG